MTYEQITLIIGVIVLTLITYRVFAAPRSSGITLRERFISLHDPVGKTLDEIIAAAGRPKERERLDSFILIYTWYSQNYRIILRFEKEQGVSICTDVLSEDGK